MRRLPAIVIVFLGVMVLGLTGHAFEALLAFFLWSAVFALAWHR